MQIAGVQAAAGQQGGPPGTASGDAGIFSLFFEAAVAGGTGGQEGPVGENPALALLDSMGATAEAAPFGSTEDEADDSGEDIALELLAASLAVPTPVPAAQLPSASSGLSVEGEGIGSSTPSLSPALMAQGSTTSALDVPNAGDASVVAAASSSAVAETAADGGHTAPFASAEAAEPESGVKVISWSGVERRREKDGEPTADGKQPVKDRAGTERLWGFWLRRGRGPAEGPKFEMARGQGAVAGDAHPEPNSGDESEPVITLRPLPWGQDPERQSGPPVGPRIETELSETDATLDATPGAEHLVAAGQPSLKEAPAAVQDASGISKPSPYASHASPPAEQVVRGIKLSLSLQGDRVTVQLEPASLGKVELVLARSEDGLAAHFRVETPQAHQALLSEAPALRQALESRGIPLVEVFVDMEDRRQQGAEDGRSARKNGSRRQTEREEIRGAEHGTAPPGLTMTWGIDTRV